MAKTRVNKILTNIYYNPEHFASYTGARNLINFVKNKKLLKNISKDEILNWLNTQDTYTLHKPARKYFKRRMYNVSGVDDVWEADLIDVRSLSTYNNGYTYLLSVIDVLSKFAWVEPLKDKTSVTVANAFKHILERSGSRAPRVLQTDRGKEFVGSPFQKLLRKKDIIFRVARNPDIKAAIVERFNRTIKERMWRYFTHSRSKCYVDVLPKLISSYNHTKHSATKFAPYNVNNKNASEAFANLQKRYGYKNNNHNEPPAKYKCGDLVRISSGKAAFAKAYAGGWSKEIFRVDRVSSYRNPIVYILRDLNGEKIDGIFYEEELSKILGSN